MAVTLNQNIQTCGKILYQTGIPDVYVVLIEESEEFLDNEKLKITEYEESTIYEAELRGALNSLELSTDALYKDINFRICQLQRQQIIASQAMLQQQMEVLQDSKGRTLYSHTSGEVAIVHKCKKVLFITKHYEGIGKTDFII